MIEFLNLLLIFIVSSCVTETIAQNTLINTITSSPNLISVKIIEEPALFLANINLQNFENSNILNIATRNKPEPSNIKPSKFSGPPQLEEISEQCFETISKKCRFKSNLYKILY